uniref:Uncharacterized protein n=1 Tax=Cacopsylla melanoneura TaxID=428564 RepID=A0A8D9F3K7_9HEMI
MDVNMLKKCNLLILVVPNLRSPYTHLCFIIKMKQEIQFINVSVLFLPASGCLFVFPDKEDISYVDKSDIVKCVSFPNMGRRGETYEFDRDKKVSFHITLR